MRFPTRLLAEGEEVVTEVHPHWTFLGWPLVTFVTVALVSLGVLVALTSAPVGVFYVLMVALVVSFVWLSTRYLRRRSSSVVVTTTRILRRSGVFSRVDLEIRLQRINELWSRQTFVGRLLGEGDVLIEVGGETGVVLIDRVPHPGVLQSIISEQVNKWHSEANRSVIETRLPMIDTPPTGNFVPREGSGRSAADRLVELDELRRRGIVSEQEYETKKAQLLGEL